MYTYLHRYLQIACAEKAPGGCPRRRSTSEASLGSKSDRRTFSLWIVKTATLKLTRSFARAQRDRETERERETETHRDKDRGERGEREGEGEGERETFRLRLGLGCLQLV